MLGPLTPGADATAAWQAWEALTGRASAPAGAPGSEASALAAAWCAELVAARRALSESSADSSLSSMEDEDDLAVEIEALVRWGSGLCEPLAHQ